MSRRERFKQGIGEITGSVKGLFARKDKSATRPSIPSITQAHTHISTLAGQADDLEAAASGCPDPSTAREPIGLPDVHLSSSSGIGEQSKVLPRATAPVMEDHGVAKKISPSVPEASAQVLGGSVPNLTEPTVSQPRILDDSANGPNVKPSAKPSSGRDLVAVAKEVVGSTADVFKFGPLQAVFDQFGVLGDAFKMKETAEKEYEILQDMIRTVLKRLDAEFGRGLASTPPGIDRLRESIEGELETVKNKQVRSPGRRFVEAQNEADEIQACYRRIAGYWGQLTLDTNNEIRRIADEQSKARIDRLPSSPSAWYDSSAGAELRRRGCTPGTRIEVLANLLSWAGSHDSQGVYWLNGMAGTGKTTIAYSVCKQLDLKQSLAASFFCSRLREECRNVNMIIPSIAYQLALHFPSYRSALCIILEKEPDAYTKRLDAQFKTLIEEPLLAVKPALPQGLVVVIDALDECENEESTRDILSVLLSKAEDIPIKFIVSSRPEQQIRVEMSSKRVQSRLVLHELDTGKVQTDIETYLRQELKPMQPSPTEEQFAALVERAGILFIYAATAARYISYMNFRRNPAARLRTILDGTQTGRTKQNKEVDELYTTILKAALDDQDLDEDEKDDMKQVLYTVICAREPLMVRTICQLLQMGDNDRVQSAIQPLYSVLHVVEENEVVTTLHASFPDFMFDPERSKIYWCDSDAHHRKIVQHCFECIAQTQPKVNKCRLETLYCSDEDVPNIKERVAESISSELLYACRYWADHARAATCATSMAEALQDFLSKRLLLWMEVLNLTSHMNDATACTKAVVSWCQAYEAQEELLELAYDARRFVEAFAANPVSQSTPHIYVSMLAFWPRSAPISNHYVKNTRRPVEAEGTALSRRQLAHISTWDFKGYIQAMAVSTDGLYLAISIGTEVLLLDSTSGRKVLEPLQGHPKMVKSVAFLPDKPWVLGGSFGDEGNYATILGWDTRTGNAVLGPIQLRGHTGGIECLRFSPDCSRIATGSKDKTACLWDTESGNMLHQLQAHGYVYATAFSADGHQLISGANKTLHRWDTWTGQPVHTPITHTEDFHMIAISPDQSHLISGSRSRQTIYVWNALTGDMIRSVEGHTEDIRCIGYSPDGRYIVSGSYDRTVRVWDAQTGNIVLGPLKGHTGWINSIVFSPDGTRIISACDNGLVCTWDAQQRGLTSTSTDAPSDRVACAKFSSDGAHFVSGSEDGRICIRDAQTGEISLGPLGLHTDRINALDYMNDRVVSGSDDGKICVWDAESGEVVLGPLQVGSGTIRSIAYSPDGELIATGSGGGVNVWNAQDGSRVLGRLPDLRGTASSVQFSADGTRIAASSVGSRSNVVVWDVPDGRSVFGTLDGHQDLVDSVAYSPNGTLIASGSIDRTIILWDGYTGKKAMDPLTGHSSYVLSVSFSPDSTRLVSGSDNRTIWIWDVHTGEMVFELLHGHEDWITSVEYSPDGTHIMSRSGDMSVRIHDARSPEERAQGRSESDVGDWTIRQDGWVVDDQSRLLVWVPGDLRKALMWSATHVMVAPQGYVRLKFDKTRMGEAWAESYASQM